MEPLLGDVYFSLPLQQISVSFVEDQNYIADLVFPTVDSPAIQGTYRKFGAEDWLRKKTPEEMLLADGARTRGDGFEFTTDTYLAKVYGWHSPIGPQTLAAAGGPAGLPGLERQKTRYVTMQTMNMREAQFLAKYFAAVWTTNITGVTSGAVPGTSILQWDQGASNPIKDVRYLKRLVGKLTGFTPNVMVIGPEVEDALMENSAITGKISFGQPGRPSVVTRELLAALFGVDRLLVPDVRFNTAERGLTASYSYAYGKNVLLVYAPEEAGTETPSAGYIFPWTGYLGAAAYGGRMLRRLDNLTDTILVENQLGYDMKQVSQDLGVFITGATA